MTKKRNNICFIIPSVKSGGIETYLLRFLKYLNKEYDCTVLVRSFEKAELYEDYLKTGVKIYFRPMGYFNPANMLWYYNFFRKNSFDVVCDFNANFAGIPIWLSYLSGIKKRVTFYRQSSHHFRLTKVRLVYSYLMNRLVYNFSTDIFSNSVSGLNFFFGNEHRNDNRFKVIKNGVNRDDFLPLSVCNKNALRKKLELPEEKVIIGHTGRFAEAKNHYFLLKVAKEIIKVNNSVFFVLIGNNTEKLIPYAEELGIINHMKILGYRNNIPEYLKAFDVFFFPSITEGQPNALIEAMITGLPIAASNIPPIVECLPEKGKCCLIDPYDAVTTSEKILQILNGGEKYVMQQHALENFDAKVQFKVFKDALCPQ